MAKSNQNDQFVIQARNKNRTPAAATEAHNSYKHVISKKIEQGPRNNGNIGFYWYEN